MDLTTIPTFAEDETFHVVVESPRGSRVKLKDGSRAITLVYRRP